jgi:hypothetical protein
MSIVNGDVGHAAQSNNPQRMAAIKNRKRFTKNIYVKVESGTEQIMFVFLLLAKA